MPEAINDGLTNQKRWRQTDKGKFIRNRNHWIVGGIVEPLEGWKEFWEVYKKKTHCELCNIEFDLENGKTSKKARCLDHHHNSGAIRNVICRYCNMSPMRNFDKKHNNVILELHRYFLRNILQ